MSDNDIDDSHLPSIDSGDPDDVEAGAFGGRLARLGTVDATTTRVEVPTTVEDDTPISVVGSALDDEAGAVELSVGGDASICVTLPPEAARSLAEKIMAAADEAEVDPTA